MNESSHCHNLLQHLVLSVLLAIPTDRQLGLTDVLAHDSLYIASFHAHFYWYNFLESIFGGLLPIIASHFVFPTSDYAACLTGSIWRD